MTKVEGIKPNISVEYEKAITFLVNSYAKSGHNPKPVVFHSLRIAYKLLEMGYDDLVVKSAILHDLLEDTDIKANDILKEFGEDVLSVVSAVSMNMEIEDYKKRYVDMFSRTLIVGRAAVLVKAADLYDNSQYYHLVEDNKLLKNLLEKSDYFLELSEEYKDELVLKLLAEQAAKQKIKYLDILD